jgi:hypothetical protein
MALSEYISRTTSRPIDICQEIIKTTSVQFGEARIVVVASHAHAMYRPSHPDIIPFGDLEKEGFKKLESFQDVQAGLQRSVAYPDWNKFLIQSQIC